MAAPIRIAFLGNGFTRKVILPCLRHVDGIELVGLASPNLERARHTAEEFGIAEVSDDHRKILNTTRPDLVFVVTPPHRHLDQTLDAIRSGCHVVCEKPTALSAGESIQMLEAARKHPDRMFLIDHELRFDPRRQLLKEWIDTGRLGEIRHAVYELRSNSLSSSDVPWSWWSDADQGGGALGALASHAVDALRVLLGEVDCVRGHLHTFVKQRVDPESGRPRAVTSDDFAAAWLRFRSGALATVTLSMVEPERTHRITVAGTRGGASVEEQGPLRAGFDGAPPEVVAADDDLPDSTFLGIPDTDWARNFIRFSRAIISTISVGETRVQGAADFEDGHRNQQVLDAIRTSHESGAWAPV